VLVEIENKE